MSNDENKAYGEKRGKNTKQIRIKKLKVEGKRLERYENTMKILYV